MVDLYERVLGPLLFLLEPESAHEKAIGLLRWTSRHDLLLNELRRRYVFAEPRLKVSVFGLDFPNPTGLAAGFDKNAIAFPALAAIGFGFIEVGTITASLQPGNPRPRLFRFPENKALVNRLGFNNDGAETVAARLSSRGELCGVPLGINLGKSKIIPLGEATEDYLRSFRLLRDRGDYFAINISSPNTPDLRKLQEKDRLDELLAALRQENVRGVPMLVKIDPDLSLEQIDDVLDLVQKHNMAGIIATNTTIQRPASTPSLQREQGGLSGQPLRELANRCIGHLWQRTRGRLPVIGVGGIFTAEDAYEKIKLGASLVQLYTGFVYGGIRTASRINRGLLRLMERDGVNNISEVVGTA